MKAKVVYGLVRSMNAMAVICPSTLSTPATPRYLVYGYAGAVIENSFPRVPGGPSHGTSCRSSRPPERPAKHPHGQMHPRGVP